MPDEKAVYSSDSERYEALIAREDHEHNIESALGEIIRADGLDVIDLGTGTGRLAAMLAGRTRTVYAFDTSPHMLSVARGKLDTLAPGRSLVAAADHRFIPLPAGCTDLIVSGWSVSYVAVWSPEHWRAELDAWAAEVMRLLRPGGTVVLFESLGTGNETPRRLPHLENFYAWLEEAGFRQTWIRTDYRFESVGQAAELCGFFFGEELAGRIRREGLTLLPECTGVWWRGFPES
ncbi:MAG TPA: methyltransferase domain-containing protein [Anaerolineales bacterium]